MLAYSLSGVSTVTNWFVIHTHGSINICIYYPWSRPGFIDSDIIYKPLGPRHRFLCRRHYQFDFRRRQKTKIILSSLLLLCVLACFKNS